MNLDTRGALLATSNTQFGTGALSLNTADFLTAPNNPAYHFGLGDFTIEFWMYKTSAPTPAIIVSQGGYTVGGTDHAGWTVYMSSSTLNFNLGTTVLTFGTAGISAWHHVAITRSGTSVRAFVDGVQSGTTYTDSPLTDLTNTTDPFCISTNWSLNTGVSFRGFLDDIRITKGVARYTAAFTPSAVALPDFGPPVSPITAAGGTITTVGDYKIHTFTSSGTFAITDAPAGSTIDVLVVAGGGSGGLAAIGGGGGGGGVVEQLGRSVTAGSYTVTVGAGGAAQTTVDARGNSGSNSVFDTITAVGGGGGAGQSLAGNTGGSGGGGGYNTTAGGAATQAVSGGGTGFGTAGGTGASASRLYAGAGGGGATAAGSAGTVPAGNATGGAGGAGLQSAISGTAKYYGGGGGGAGGADLANNEISGAGGAGGGGGGGLYLNSSGTKTAGGAGADGGNAGNSSTGAAGAGGTNTGGGGGGATHVGASVRGGGAGGSGVVIVRYQIQ
jgi:hypothetical protein